VQLSHARETTRKYRQLPISNCRLNKIQIGKRQSGDWQSLYSSSRITASFSWSIRVTCSFAR
jgi:hypothetical protein